ncbi:MAG: DUF2505 domain-containing protein [Myxococcota bacterium]|nr:DUF2505 domain-containing protein [Myxococcota bacterium]
MRIVAEHVYDCEPKAFWAHHLDEESRRAKEVEGCGAVSFRVLSKERQGGAVIVRSELVEALNVPASVRRAFGATLRAEEVLRWEEGSNTATFEHTPETLPDRVRLSGRLTTEPTGDGRCRVILDAEVTVKLFGMAGVIERVLAKQLPLRQEKAMSWFNANLCAR